MANVMHAAGVDVMLARPRRLHVSAALRGQVDDHAATLHERDHIARDQDGRLLVGDEGGRNYDVHLAALLLEKRVLGGNKVGRHLLACKLAVCRRLRVHRHQP